MSTKERLPTAYMGDVESPFLHEEFFVGESEEKWELHGALATESPFLHPFKEDRISFIEPEELEEELSEAARCAGDHELPNFEGELLDSEIWEGTAEQIAFRDSVLNAHIALSRKRQGPPKRDLSRDELGPVLRTEIKMGLEAAAAASRLLETATVDLEKAWVAGHTDALRTISLTATSGYRSSDHQKNLWLQYFTQKGGYYERTQRAREGLADGPHSEQAITYMLTPKNKGGFGLGGRIAAPGYSNHQGGIAIDLKQKRKNGHEIWNKSDDEARAKWRKSWFHQWLRENADTFGFKPLSTEEWHWEYHRGSATTDSAASATSTRPSSVTTTALPDRSTAGPAAPTDYLRGKLAEFTATTSIRVAVFCPKAASTSDELDVLVYVHGLLSPCPPIPTRPADLITDAPFALGKIVDASNRKIILAVPFLEWKRQQPHPLSDPAKLNQFVDEVLDKVGRMRGTSAPSLRSLILAGHSRAYGFLDPLAKAHASREMARGALSKLAQVWAFDTAYSSPTEAYRGWLESNPNLVFHVFYRRWTWKDNKRVASGTKVGGEKYEQLARRLAKGASERFKVKDVPESHCSVPVKWLPDLLASSISEFELETFAEFDEHEFNEEEGEDTEAPYDKPAEEIEHLDYEAEDDDAFWGLKEERSEVDRFGPSDEPEESDRRFEPHKHERDLDETLESPLLEEETEPLIDGEAPIWRSGTEYYRDTASGRDHVGIQRDDGHVLLAVSPNGTVVTTLASALVGMLHLNPSRPVHRFRPAELVPVSGASAGALRARFKGQRVVALANGTELLRQVGRSYQGVPSEELPETLRGQLVHGTRLEIDQELLHVWMVFRVRGESADRARWVPAKNTLAEVKARRDTFAATAARIPAGTLRSDIETHLNTLAVVSAIEGGFGSKSGAGDTHASLGIFQWAMKRDQWQETGSLGRFFRDLKTHAQVGHTSDSGSFYVNAWAEGTARGLDVRKEGERWVLTLDGTHATGSQVEARMHSAMAEGHLASYQLAASLDWIRDFQETVVWPGPLGARLLGHGWRVVASPQKARLVSGGRSLDIETTAVTRLSQVFTSQAALATAVMLGVNRPAFVPLALWRALGTPRDPSARVGELFDAVCHACDSAGQRPGNGKYTRQHVNAAGAAAQAAWETLRVFLWPAASLPAGGEAELRAIFERKALWLYDADDARKFKREGRFATVRVLLP